MNQEIYIVKCSKCGHQVELPLNDKMKRMGGTDSGFVSFLAELTACQAGWIKTDGGNLICPLCVVRADAMILRKGLTELRDKMNSNPMTALTIKLMKQADDIITKMETAVLMDALDKQEEETE